jgi:hypothetical protein
MKKTHKHTDLSNVECANKDCRKVNSKQGPGPRKFIKQNVVDRAGENHGPLYCYKCSKARKGQNIGNKYMTAGS